MITNRPKGETDKITFTIGGPEHPNKKILALNDTLDQMYLINISRTFHHKMTEYIFFSSAHGTFSRIDHMLRHKTSLNEFKETEIIQSIYSDHNSVKMETN